MPRVVLYEDDGTEVFSGDVDRAIVAAIVGVVDRNRGVARAVAVTVQVLRELAAVAAPPPGPRKGRALPAVEYLPPPRRKRTAGNR